MLFITSFQDLIVLWERSSTNRSIRFPAMPGVVVADDVAQDYTTLQPTPTTWRTQTSLRMKGISLTVSRNQNQGKVAILDPFGTEEATTNLSEKNAFKI